jgi:transposase
VNIITGSNRRSSALCPAPRRRAPALSFEVREAIEARCAMLRYLPKYSPDLNPIEMPFSKLNAYLRKAAERTIPRLRRRIGRFARTLTTREASNYFRHAGDA